MTYQYFTVLIKLKSNTLPACPPNSVQNEDICYYTDDITAGDYDHITDSCHQFDWVGPGYTVMPKDWLQFDFIEALVYP